MPRGYGKFRKQRDPRAVSLREARQSPVPLERTIRSVVEGGFVHTQRLVANTVDGRRVWRTIRTTPVHEFHGELHMRDGVEDFITTSRIDLNGALSYDDLVQARDMMWDRNERFPVAELDLSFAPSTATEEAARFQMHSTPMGATRPWLRWVRTEGRAV